MNWVAVCQIDDVNEDEPKAVDIGETKIGIFKIENQIYAIENVCPHAYALLSEGFVEGETVECPLHEAIFNVTTGALESGPGCRDLCTYPVKVEGSSILIQA